MTQYTVEGWLGIW